MSLKKIYLISLDLFLKTHTLSRDNKFVPLSDLNLKNSLAEDRMRTSGRYSSKFSDDDSDSAFKRSSYLKPNSRFNTDGRLSARTADSGDDKYRRPGTNSVVPYNMSVVPYRKPGSDFDDKYRKSNLRTLSDGSSDEGRYRRGASNQRRGTLTLDSKDSPMKPPNSKIFLFLTLVSRF